MTRDTSPARDEAIIPTLRWHELRRLLRTTSLLGLAIGGTGTVVETILLIPVLIPAIFERPFYPPNFSGWIILALVAAAVLVPFLSALGLLFLPLKDDQRDILGYVTLISSVVALLPTYYFLFFLYCDTTHATCS